MNRPLTPSLSPSDGERVAEGRVRGWFMVPISAQKRKEASHEPYSQVIGNEQNNRDRFMASINVRILEVSPSHEPYPLIPSFPPSGGAGARRAGEGASDRHMPSLHVPLFGGVAHPCTIQHHSAMHPNA